MKLTHAANIFLKHAQILSTTTVAPSTNTVNFNNTVNEIKKLSNILADPHVKEDLSNGLVFTLDYKIKQQYNSESKIKNPALNTKKIISSQMLTDLNNLSNTLKLFYNTLSISPIDINNISNHFANLKHIWENFRNNDFTDAWLLLVLQQSNQNVQTWWKKLKQKIDDTIKSIDTKIQEAKKYTVPTIT